VYDKDDVALKCWNMTACYTAGSRHPVLKEVNLEVRRQEIVGLLGPNGSGKSSTLNAIVGHLRILQGTVSFNGEEISRSAPEAIARRGARLFPQGGRIFSDLTVDENLQVAASCAPRRSVIEKDVAYQWFPDLAPRAGSRAGLLSGGQRQMLSLSMVLLHVQVRQPLIFLLDEPSGSLDPPHRKRLAEVLLEARDHYGVSILLAEENAVFAKQVCERFYQFVEPGRVEPFTSGTT